MAAGVHDGTPSIAQEFRQGWKALLGCIVGLAFGASLMLYTSGVFVQALQTQFGWTRSQLSSVSLLSVLTVIPFSPIVGMTIDRWGVMLPVAIGMAGMAAGFTAMGLMTGNFYEYVAIYIVTSVFALMASHIGLTRAVSEAFDRARGLALALAMAVAGGIAALSPIVLINILTKEGWRTAFFGLAAVILIAMPFAAILLWKKPRSGGQPIFVATRPDPLPRPAVTAMLKEPLVRRLCAVFFFMVLGVTGYTFHLIPMLVDTGMPAAEAARLQALFGIAIIVGRLVIGPLFDHFFAPFVVAASLAVTIAGVAAFAIAGPVLAPLFVLALGLSLGAEGDLIGFLTSRYFGMANYGRYFGVFYAAFLLANGCSALLISLIAERLGGYHTALWVSAVFPGIAIVLLITAPRFNLQPEHCLTAAQPE